MTYREYAEKYFPSLIDEMDIGGVANCPGDMLPGAPGAYLCPSGICNEKNCRACWDKDIPARLIPADKPSEAPTKMPAVSRAAVLDEAKKYICSDRNAQYGEPEDNFAAIAALWNPYLKARFGFTGELTGADVGLLMALFKIGRIESGQTKRDNYVDCIGYVACAAEIALREKK